MLMLACGKDHLVDLVVACKMSRVARDLEFNVLVLKQLSRAGVEMTFVHKACKNGQAGQLHQTRISRKDEGAIVKAF